MSVIMRNDIEVGGTDDDVIAKVGTAELTTQADDLSAAVNELNSSMTYKAGDYFSPRSWKAIGRVINSGRGIFVTIYLPKPIIANGATISVGNVNIYGISNNNFDGTISTVSISGNELSFVLGTTASNPAGTLTLAELNDTAITLT